MLQKLALLVSLLLSAALRVNGGVTIHYEGTAKSPDAVAEILSSVTTFAKKHSWSVEDASSKDGQLKRIIEEKDKDYKGRITGVVVRITDNCEPLHFQFDDNLFMQDYVKTQFAGAEVHVQIVELLESLRPYFTKINVVDEGDYWDSRDRMFLEGHIAKVNSIISDIKQKNPQAQGSLPMKSGRIADIVQ